MNRLFAFAAAAVALVAVQSDVFAQCTPVHNCQIDSTSWTDHARCPDSQQGDSHNTEGWGDTVDIDGVPYQRLNVSSGVDVVQGEADALDAQGNTIGDCSVQSNGPFQRFVAGPACDAGVNARVFSTYCLE
jgi:hypothetical protein